MAVSLRARGNFRHRNCDFPPVTLNFRKSQVEGTLFERQDKLKMVAHCKITRQYEQSVLREYLAYRLLNSVTDLSFRVRLLQVVWVDSEERRASMVRSAFLIEHKDRLAARIGRTEQEIESAEITAIEPDHLNLLSMFQYLIGNSDWSLVTAEDEEHCCHNIDLIDSGDEWFLVPYDFDLAGLVDAKYRSSFNINQTRRRVYGGYCKTPPGQMGAALDAIGALEDDIIDLAKQVPSVEEASTSRRVEYLEGFFSADRDELLQVFDKHCLGRR